MTTRGFFFNQDGAPFTLDTTTNTVTYASNDVGCCYGDNDLSLSSNQNSFAASGYQYDSNLNAISFLSSGIYDPLVTQYVYGEKLSPDGSLLFQPAVSGIDDYDGRLDVLRRTVGLPVELSQNLTRWWQTGKTTYWLPSPATRVQGLPWST